MKVTPNTHGVEISLYDSFGNAFVRYNPSSSDPVARVIEFPKVVRKNGKQYKVDSYLYVHNGDFEDYITVKAPEDASFSIYGCRLDHVKFEDY